MVFTTRPEIIFSHPPETDRRDLPSPSLQSKSLFSRSLALISRHQRPLYPVDQSGASPTSRHHNSGHLSLITVFRQQLPQQQHGAAAAATAAADQTLLCRHHQQQCRHAAACRITRTSNVYPVGARVTDTSDPRVISNFPRSHDRPLPFAFSVRDDRHIFKRRTVLDPRAIWFMYIRPPGNKQNQFTIRFFLHCSIFYEIVKFTFLCNFPNSQHSPLPNSHKTPSSQHPSP